MLTIHFPSGETLEVQPAQGSRAVEQLLQPAFVEAQFARQWWVEVPVGAWVELEGRRYTLYAPAAATRDGATLYDYRARFESDARGLEAIVALNPVDGRAAFPLTATPEEHAELVVQNMNARGGGGWRLGGCVAGAPKEISYDGTPCLAALGRIAEAFETEWQCDGKVITIGRVGHGAEDPVPLRYGEGLKPGLQRTVHSEDGNPVGRLFVQGGERNVSYSDYGKERLHLPKASTVSFDGLHFEGESGFVAARAVRYATDAAGASVARADALPGVTYREATLSLEECYPRRVGTVTAVGAGGLDFVDSAIPADLNYRDARIGGEKATIIFQSGMLAGREFDIVQTEKDLTGYDHGARRFQLVPQDEDGVSMPGGVFVPRAGDRYAVFHINMPPRYVRDAEEEMLRGAVRYLHPRAGHRFTVRAELDAAWARARWANLGGRLGLGGYVAIEDRELFGASGDGRAVLRVVEVSRPLGDPHAPTLTLSNEPAAGGIFTQLARAQAQEQVVATRHAEAVRYTRRTFRQAQEGLKQLEAAARGLEERFTESIRPATVTTMGALVGSEATNFTFLNRVEFTWEGAGRRLRARAVDGGAMVLEHATLGGEPQGRGTLSAAGAAARRWNLYAFVSGALTAAGKPYFLYAECPGGAGATDGRFAVSEEARPLREGDRYNLLCALVSSEDGRGNRSVQPVFGVTEVTPGMVRTGRIVSRGGETYFDLEHGEIGGNIRFTIPEAAGPAAVSRPNLFSNGGPMIKDVEGWRLINNDSDWAVIMEQVEEEAHGGYGRIRYTARRTKTEQPDRLYKIGQIWAEVPLAVGGAVCAAVGLARCTHPRAVMFEGYFGGGYPRRNLAEMRRASSMAGNPSRADLPFAQARGEAAETAVFGPLPRSNGGLDMALSWFVDSAALPNAGLGEEVVLEFVWLKVEAGETFTGAPVTKEDMKCGQGFTVVDGGRLRTFGLELMQGRGAGAKATAGLWGGGFSGNYNENTPAFWAGGTFEKAMNGEANTILRHDGSAKIGRMLVASEGDIDWTDNGGFFRIIPTQNMPSWDDIETNAGRNVQGNQTEYARDLHASLHGKVQEDRENKTIHIPIVQITHPLPAGQTVRVNVKVTLHATLYTSASKNAESSAGARFSGGISVDSEERKEITLTLSSWINSSGNPQDEDSVEYDFNCKENATCWLSGTLQTHVETSLKEAPPDPGTGRDPDPSNPLRPDPSNPLRPDPNDPGHSPAPNPHNPDEPDNPNQPGIGHRTHGYAAPRPVLRAAGDETRLMGKNGGTIRERYASASVKSPYLRVDYFVYYENVKGQQQFIIAKDGFCIFHNARRYIYCNASNGQFEVMGLTNFSRQ